jgi:hypothetical protein
MANLIDYTYFTGEINIPISGINMQTVLADYIAKYEPEILKMLLGYSLYKDFTAGISIASPLQKWIDLKDGKEFTFTLSGQTITTYFEGLKKIVAYYVYFKYRCENDTSYSGQSQVKNSNENAENVDNAPKLVQVWNKFLKLYGKEKYWDFTPISYYYHWNAYPSAYNFLLANKTDYSNWIFESQDLINEFGI